MGEKTIQQGHEDIWEAFAENHKRDLQLCHPADEGKHLELWKAAEKVRRVLREYRLLTSKRGVGQTEETTR